MQLEIASSETLIGRASEFNRVLGDVSPIEMRVREPQVIKVSAATLGLLGFWNLAGFALAMMSHSRFAGHPFDS
jgi:hypothetical protein